MIRLAARWKACCAGVLWLMAPMHGLAQPSLTENLSLLPPMVADSSLRSVEIHSSFNGTELLIFGAKNEGGELVLVVRGPAANVVLRRKARIAGMWMHVEQQKYSKLPMFFALASTQPIEKILSPQLQHYLLLGEESLLEASQPHALAHFDDALKKQMLHWQLWQEPAAPITFFGESLFKTTVHLPDRLPRGDFTIEAYLFNQGTLLSMQTIPLQSYTTGFEANLRDLAEESALLYGMLSIALALMGGWLAHRLFHR
jgi:uncharacterized protein (TIGR02186 family)